MNNITKVVVLAVAVVSAVVLYLVLQNAPNVASDASSLLGR